MEDDVQTPVLLRGLREIQREELHPISRGLRGDYLRSESGDGGTSRDGVETRRRRWRGAPISHGRSRETVATPTKASKGGLVGPDRWKRERPAHSIADKVHVRVASAL